jgi:hypothetical protein
VLRNWRRSSLVFAFLCLNWALAVLTAAAAADPDRLLFIRPEDQRVVLFTAVDGGRSVFLTTGSKQSIVGPLDRTGFVVMETSGFGITRETFQQGGNDVRGTRFTTQTSTIVGHQWNLSKLFLSAFIGPEILHEQLTVAGRAYRFSEPRYGAKGQVELWSNPTPETLLTATLVGTTANLALWARGSAGIRVRPGLFVGPEVTSYVTGTYRETKVGAHLTGFQFGLLQGRASAGWMITDDGRPGSPYMSLSAWIRL